MASPSTQPRTVTLPDPLKPPAATGPTDVIGLRVRGTDIEHRLDRRGLWWMLGRGPKCDFRFPDDMYMSTAHAVINREPETGALMLHDRSTKGATFINGVRCASGYLHDGVRIQLGATVLLAFSAESRDVWTPFERLVGSSPIFTQARELLIGAAESHSHVLLVGPAGSGKRTMAEALHQESQRAVGRFVEVDCAAGAAVELPSALAIAAEAAAAGTVLVANATALDAAGLRTLIGLLRSFRPGAARLVMTASEAEIVASPAWEPVCELAFRITVPSLWERTLDIAALVKSFVREFGVRALQLPAEDVAALAGRDWPGEVAELRRTIGHAVVESKETLQLAGLWRSDEERVADLTTALLRAVAQAPSRHAAAEGLGLPWTTFRRLAARHGA